MDMIDRTTLKEMHEKLKTQLQDLQKINKEREV